MITKTKAGAKSLKFRVRIIVEKDEPGYHAYAPSLKGLHMGGDTVQEALNNAKEAATLFLQTMIEDGDPIPIDVIVPPEEQKPTRLKNNAVSNLEEIQVDLV